MLQIKRFRELKGFTVRDMAERLHMNVSNYSQIENNKGNPTIDTLSKIAKVLERPIQDLIKEEEE